MKIITIFALSVAAAMAIPVPERVFLVSPSSPDFAHIEKFPQDQPYYYVPSSGFRLPASPYSNVQFVTQQKEASTPLKLELNKPAAIDSNTKTVPLYLIPQPLLQLEQQSANDKTVVNNLGPFNVVGSSASSNKAVPAIAIQLKEPIKVTSPQTAISLPAAFAIENNKGTVPFQVAAVLAPTTDKLKEISPKSPAIVQLLIAVPEGSSLSISLNVQSQPQTTTSTLKPTTSPEIDSVDIDINNRPENNREPSIIVEAAPIIDSINFPDTLSSPGQTQVEGEDLTNREPPASAPGGIIQSGAPTIVELPFQNSKDSPFLIAMQEEAQIQHGTLQKQNAS